MSKKGVTMISLIFYILSFFVIVSVIGSINIYISKNMDNLSNETDLRYSQHQLDKFLRKYFKREDNFKIINDENDSDYIVFNKIGDSSETYTIRYYPQSMIRSRGYIFLEHEEKNGTLLKKIPIAGDINGLNIYETETALGKSIEFEVKTKKDDETISSVLVYGVNRWK